jgi:hypothetical protein
MDYVIGVDTGRSVRSLTDPTPSVESLKEKAGRPETPGLG